MQERPTVLKVRYAIQKYIFLSTAATIGRYESRHLCQQIAAAADN